MRDAIDSTLGGLFAGRHDRCSLDELMGALRAAGYRYRRARVTPILDAMDREEHGSIVFREGHIHRT